MGSQTRNVQILRTDNLNCSCASKFNQLYKREYCVPKILLNDYTNYNTFRSATVYADLMYITFFCQVLKLTDSCNQLANLCVLSNYNLDKNSPCNVFFATQTSLISNGNDFFYKTVPSLFYKKGKDSIDELHKVLDHEYSTLETDDVCLKISKIFSRLSNIHYYERGFFLFR